MAKYVRYLLVFALAGSYALIAAPSSAETVIKLDSKVTDVINKIFSEQVSASDTTIKSIGNPVNSATIPTSNSSNLEQVVVSDAGSKVSDSAVAVRKSNSNQRVPLPSRIFDAPSMQQ